MDEFIRNATIEDFKRGYVWDSKKAEFICLICGEYIGQNDDSVKKTFYKPWNTYSKNAYAR
ncbi:hypothetical protein [Clostridium magnum]|uniref:Uncharacterized protein n=1 Tax=Clostridium magnum DSM 2767 TaxID=1121326 RepID=A0A162RXB5_9CLOT|nr:hypothetical protein [Clostridium magnum]KZL90500.1 hypothetical protein CLMAG_42720 [Clostridium magnum DSM 2767]SHI03582.1 hypothetical protein SAMN02745944_02172 [Clostridium magnum DSM 2767]